MRNIGNKLIVGVVGFFTAFCIIFFYAGIKSVSVVPVLMYHSVNYGREESSLRVRPDIFKKQMEFLYKNHYNVVGPEKVIAYMKKEEKMPPKTVSITADDGFYDFYQYAFPVLKKYNLKATVFVITDKIGAPGMLGWDQLREMSNSGLITVASHTKSHPWLPGLSADRAALDEELKGSKIVLEKGLGKSVDFICYPSGSFDRLVEDAAKSAGYKGAFTTNPAQRSDIEDIYAIRRLKMSSSSADPVILWAKISRYYAWFKERR